MWKIISAPIKIFKNSFYGAIQKLVKVFCILRTQMGLLLCPCICIHFIYSFGSTVGAIPFRIRKLDNGFRLFIPTVGIRKWVTKFILLFTVFRGILFLPVGFSSRMQWTVNGLLTADFMMWFFCIGYASFWSVMSLKMLFNSKECELLFNGITKLTMRFGNEYMDGKNILELHAPQLVIYAGYLAGFVMVGTPVMTAGVVITCLNSPLVMSYYIVGSSPASRTDFLHSLLFWCCQTVEWITFTYAIWLVTVSLTAVLEGLASAAFVFKDLRNSPHVSWTAKIKYHAQAELLIKIANDIGATAITVGICQGVMLASSCTTVLVKMDVDRGFPPVAWIPGFCIALIGAVIAGFMCLKFAEYFREESIGLQAEVEAEITAYFRHKPNRRGCSDNAYRPTGRSFRRRPIGLRFGSFMHIDSGICVTYLTQIVDNTLSLVFMVDLWSVPIWIIS